MVRHLAREVQPSPLGRLEGEVPERDERPHVLDVDPQVRQRAILEVKFLAAGPARRILDEVLKMEDEPRLVSLGLAQTARCLGHDAIDAV